MWKSGFLREEGDYRKTKEFVRQLTNMLKKQLEGRHNSDKESGIEFEFVLSSPILKAVFFMQGE